MTAITEIKARERTTLVSLLRWVYRDQKADVMSGRGLHGLEAAADGDEGGAFGHGTSCCATVEMNGLLGTIIRSTAYQQRPSLHADAELVHDAVMAMGGDWRGPYLLVQYAKQGGTPSWVADQRLEPVMVGGKPDVREVDRVTVRYANRETRVVPVTCCPVELYPSDAWAAMCRAEYAAWYRALASLAMVLDRAELSRWEVDGIGAEREPWVR